MTSSVPHWFMQHNTKAYPTRNYTSVPRKAPHQEQTISNSCRLAVVWITYEHIFEASRAHWHAVLVVTWQASSLWLMTSVCPCSDQCRSKLCFPVDPAGLLPKKCTMYAFLKCSFPEPSAPLLLHKSNFSLKALYECSWDCAIVNVQDWYGVCLHSDWQLFLEGFMHANGSVLYTRPIVHLAAFACLRSGLTSHCGHKCSSWLSNKTATWCVSLGLWREQGLSVDSWTSAGSFSFELLSFDTLEVFCKEVPRRCRPIDTVMIKLTHQPFSSASVIERSTPWWKPRFHKLRFWAEKSHEIALLGYLFM